MSFDDKIHIFCHHQKMNYLNFPELIANQLHFILLKYEVKFEE